MTLFANLYGYWEPPAGWTRVSDPRKEKDGFLGGETIEFRHESLGTLTVHKPWQMDGPLIQFSLVFRERFVHDADARALALARPVAAAFLPVGHRLALESVKWDHAVTVCWETRPQQLEDTPLGKWLSTFFGRR